MKCKKCGMELGQKNVCPVCSIPGAEQPEPISAAPDVRNNQGALIAGANGIPLEEAVRIELQRFLDTNCYGWEAAFERDFGSKEYETYVRMFEAAKALWEVRSFLMDAIRKTDAKQITPRFKIDVMTKLQEKFPEYPRDAALQWLVELFRYEVRRSAEFEKFARAFHTGDPEELGDMVYVFPDPAAPAESEDAEKITLAAPVWIAKQWVRADCWAKIIPESDIESGGWPSAVSATWNDWVSAPVTV